MKKNYEIIDYQRLQPIAIANIAIQKGTNDLGALEQDLFYCLLKKIKEESNFDEQFTISFDEIKSTLGKDFSGGKNYKYLLECLMKLYKIAWWQPVEKSEGVLVDKPVQWFNDLEVDRKGKTISYYIHPQMKKNLFQLKESNQFYIIFEMINILGLSSKYSKKLYVLLRTFSNTKQKNKKWTYSLDELRYRLLGAIDYEKNIYPKFADFKKRVLDVSVSQINENSDLTINYSLQKTGKKVVGIEFIINVKKKEEKEMAFNKTSQKLDGKDRPALALINKSGEDNNNSSQNGIIEFDEIKDICEEFNENQISEICKIIEKLIEEQYIATKKEGIKYLENQIKIFKKSEANRPKDNKYMYFKKMLTNNSPKIKVTEEEIRNINLREKQMQEYEDWIKNIDYDKIST